MPILDICQRQQFVKPFILGALRKASQKKIPGVESQNRILARGLVTALPRINVLFCWWLLLVVLLMMSVSLLLVVSASVIFEVIVPSTFGI